MNVPKTDVTGSTCEFLTAYAPSRKGKAPLAQRFAYFGVPHHGGTYAVYRSLRVGLAAHGIEVRWVGIGAAAAAAMQDQQWADEHANGHAVAVDGDDWMAASCLIEHLEREQYDGVLAGALCGRFQTNMVRYLPERFRRILIVHSITPGTYKAARGVRDHVHATIGVSPRIRADLVRSFGFDGRHTYVVPNAVELARFRSVVRRAPEGPLRLIYLGRLEDQAKGILWLPKILSRLTDLDLRLTVAGDGPDRGRLERACSALAERVTFAGRVSHDQVPGMLADHDLLLAPSRFEGFGCSLVEAMAAGCVPIVSRIRAVTDAIVRDGVSGLLFPVGDVQAAASAVRRLALDPGALERMSMAARADVQESFTVEAMAARYAAILRAIETNPRPTASPLPLNRWRYPAGLQPGLRTYLPTGLKNTLRVWRERLA